MLFKTMQHVNHIIDPCKIYNAIPLPLSCSFNSQTPEPTDSIRRVAEAGISPCCNCQSEKPRSARTESGNSVNTSREFPSQWISAVFCAEVFLTFALYQGSPVFVYKIYYKQKNPDCTQGPFRYTSLEREKPRGPWPPSGLQQAQKHLRSEKYSQAVLERSDRNQ
jgi:hypothetical protein